MFELLNKAIISFHSHLDCSVLELLRLLGCLFKGVSLVCISIFVLRNCTFLLSFFECYELCFVSPVLSSSWTVFKSLSFVLIVSYFNPSTSSVSSFSNFFPNVLSWTPFHFHPGQLKSVRNMTTVCSVKLRLRNSFLIRNLSLLLVFAFICDLFIVFLSRSDYVARNGRMISKQDWKGVLFGVH
jgi:hypothetical protein